MARAAQMTTWSASTAVEGQRTLTVRLYALGSQLWFSRCAMLPARSGGIRLLNDLRIANWRALLPSLIKVLKRCAVVQLREGKMHIFLALHALEVYRRKPPVYSTPASTAATMCTPCDACSPDTAMSDLTEDTTEDASFPTQA